MVDQQISTAIHLHFGEVCELGARYTVFLTLKLSASFLLGGGGGVGRGTPYNGLCGVSSARNGYLFQASGI